MRSLILIPLLIAAFVGGVDFNEVYANSDVNTIFMFDCAITLINTYFIYDYKFVHNMAIYCISIWCTL